MYMLVCTHKKYTYVQMYVPINVNFDEATIIMRGLLNSFKVAADVGNMNRLVFKSVIGILY